MDRDENATNTFKRSFTDLGKALDALRSLNELGLRDATLTTVSVVDGDGQVRTTYYVEAVEIDTLGLKRAAREIGEAA